MALSGNFGPSEIFGRLHESAYYLSNDTQCITVGQVVWVLQTLKVEHFFEMIKNAENGQASGKILLFWKLFFKTMLFEDKRR